MLRIHFTAADMGWLRLAAVADPLWEALLSQHLLAGRKGPSALRSWRRQAISRITPEMRFLMSLAPSTGYSADFLTPGSGLHSMDAGIDAILATPRDHLRADLCLMASQRSLPGWTRRLADGDPRALRGLTSAMRSYFDAVLGSYWDLICGQVAAERARGARIMADGGVERLLATLHPAARWEPPVLHITYPDDRDLYLDGRGLVLVPSFFCWPAPVTLRAPDRPPVLVYPIEHDPDWEAERTGLPGRELIALLGHTRAAVLQAAHLHQHGCTTSELARYVKVSLSSASEHATTLRQAGLLRARPNGKHMLHIVTPLGRALLTGRTRFAACAQDMTVRRGSTASH